MFRVERRDSYEIFIPKFVYEDTENDSSDLCLYSRGGGSELGQGTKRICHPQYRQVVS